MKQQRNYPIVTITDKGAAFLKAGHVWVYEQEVRDLIGTPADGDLVDVLTGKGRYLGTGFYNSRSKMRVRVLSTNANDTFDEAFFARRLRYCFDYRKTVMGDDFGRPVRKRFGHPNDVARHRAEKAYHLSSDGKDPRRDGRTRRRDL